MKDKNHWKIFHKKEKSNGAQSSEESEKRKLKWLLINECWIALKTWLCQVLVRMEILTFYKQTCDPLTLFNEVENIHGLCPRKIHS